MIFSLAPIPTIPRNALVLSYLAHQRKVAL
jgi:hypothetical protein